MEALIVIVVIAAFVGFIVYRTKINNALAKVLNATMKKWLKDTNGG